MRHCIGWSCLCPYTDYSRGRRLGQSSSAIQSSHVHSCIYNHDPTMLCPFLCILCISCLSECQLSKSFAWLIKVIIFHLTPTVDSHFHVVVCLTCHSSSLTDTPHSWLNMMVVTPWLSQKEMGAPCFLLGSMRLPQPHPHLGENPSQLGMYPGQPIP